MKTEKEREREMESESKSESKIKSESEKKEGYIYEVTPVLHRHRILRAFSFVATVARDSPP